MAHTVAVTGASGMVATELISQLLAKGYNVHATVRNKNDTAKVETLINLGKALPGTFGYADRRKVIFLNEILADTPDVVRLPPTLY
jgi:uncharacterized protein YbjT (DUF2867 family)